MTQPPGPYGPPPAQPDGSQPDWPGQPGQTGQPGRPDPSGPGWQQAGPSQPAVVPPAPDGGFPGRPGYPQQPLPPQSPLPLQPPAPEKKKTSTTTKALIGVLVAAVVGVGIFLFVRQQQTNTVAADVGDCIRVEGTLTTSNPDTSQIDCADPAAILVVTAVGDDSMKCGDFEVSFEQQDRGGDVTDRLCLRPNVSVGDCYVEPATFVNLPKVGACGSLGSPLELEVLAVDTTTSAETACPAETVGAYTYPERNTVICFGKP